MARELILYDFNLFKCVEVCFMAQDMIYLNKMSHGHFKNVCLLFQHSIMPFSSGLHTFQ